MRIGRDRFERESEEENDSEISFPFSRSPFPNSSPVFSLFLARNERRKSQGETTKRRNSICRDRKQLSSLPLFRHFHSDHERLSIAQCSAAKVQKCILSSQKSKCFSLSLHSFFSFQRISSFFNPCAQGKFEEFREGKCTLE